MHTTTPAIDTRPGDKASLGLGGVHQLSMDGPNVNWKTFDLLSTQIEKRT